MLDSLIHNYCKLKNIDVSVHRERSSLRDSKGLPTNNNNNDTICSNNDYIKDIDNEVYHTRYIGNKKYYDVKKRVFEIYVGNNYAKIIYGNFIEKITIKELEEYFEKQVKAIKEINKWKNTNRPKKKNKYVHMKITEYGIDYIKSKSKINFNMKI